MKKVAECIEKYYTDMGLNCAETTFMAACEAWELDGRPEILRLLGGFGGGMAVRGVCGAVTGGVAALGYRYVEVTGHQSPLLMAKVRAFVSEVEKSLGTLQCSELAPRFRTPRDGCIETIRVICRILDEVDAMPQTAAAHQPRAITPEKLEAALGRPEWAFIDTRPVSDFEAAHIPGALSCPAGSISDIGKWLDEKGINAGRKIVVCDSDLGSAPKMIDSLHKMGYPYLWYFNMGGWKA